MPGTKQGYLWNAKSDRLHFLTAAFRQENAMAMEDLNDYLYFTQVVSHGGFAAAGRALQMPKSKLSRRIAGLEERLGARLIERSSHHFRVTEVGEAFYQRCQAMLIEAERAKAVVCEANSEPNGPVRLSCPTGLVEIALASMLPDFLARYPRVQLQVLATDRRVDLIEERVHVAIRTRSTPETETELTMRVLGKARQILVASPALLERVGPVLHLNDLARLPTVAMPDAMSEWRNHDTWNFTSPQGERHAFEHQPRLSCRSIPALLEAVKAGTGMSLLLEQVCEPEIRAGRLVQILPDWYAEEGTIYLVFTTARGLPPAVRVLIDFLVTRFRSKDEQF
jgi:DNA-binding transcriptional LysR family regulator